MDAGIKYKIDTAVKEYIKLFPGEFELFRQQLKEHQYDLKHTATAAVKGTHVLEQEAYRTPAALHNAMRGLLTDDEWEEFQLKENVRWFAKKYSAFRVPRNL